MANTDTFSGYHPTVNFIYFALVLFFGMIFMHPACLAIALFGAAAYAVRLKGRKAAGFGVKFILPVGRNAHPHLGLPPSRYAVQH